MQVKDGWARRSHWVGCVLFCCVLSLLLIPFAVSNKDWEQAWASREAASQAACTRAGQRDAGANSPFPMAKLRAKGLPWRSTLCGWETTEALERFRCQSLGILKVVRNEVGVGRGKKRLGWSCKAVEKMMRELFIHSETVTISAQKQSVRIKAKQLSILVSPRYKTPKSNMVCFVFAIFFKLSISCVVFFSGALGQGAASDLRDSQQSAV